MPEFWHKSLKNFKLWHKILEFHATFSPTVQYSVQYRAQYLKKGAHGSSGGQATLNRGGGSKGIVPKTVPCSYIFCSLALASTKYSAT